MKLRRLFAASCLCAIRGPTTEAVVLRGGSGDDGEAVGVQGGSKAVDWAKLPGLIGDLTSTGGVNTDIAEELLMQAEANPGGIGQLKGILEPMVDKLLKQVNASHTTAQTAVTTSISTVNACRAKTPAMQTRWPQAPVQETTYKTLKAEEKKCSGTSAPLKNLADGCSKTVPTTEKSIKSMCTGLTAAPSHPAGTCKYIVGTHNPEQFFSDMAAFWNKQLDDYKKLKMKCGNLTASLNTEKKTCAEQKAKLATTDSACKSVKDKMAMSACNVKTELERVCKTYADCFTQSKTGFLNLKKTTDAEVPVRQLQYRMLKRLGCLLGAFSSSGAVDKAKLDGCNAKGKYSTDHLVVKYTDIPQQEKCDPTPPKEIEIPATMLKACTVTAR
jgi:hypothetical protein